MTSAVILKLFRRPLLTTVQKIRAPHCQCKNNGMRNEGLSYYVFWEAKVEFVSPMRVVQGKALLISGPDINIALVPWGTHTYISSHWKLVTLMAKLNYKITGIGLLVQLPIHHAGKSQNIILGSWIFFKTIPVHSRYIHTVFKSFWPQVAHPSVSFFNFFQKCILWRWLTSLI